MLLFFKQRYWICHSNLIVNIQLSKGKKRGEIDQLGMHISHHCYPPLDLRTPGWWCLHPEKSLSEPGIHLNVLLDDIILDGMSLNHDIDWDYGICPQFTLMDI